MELVPHLRTTNIYTPKQKIQPPERLCPGIFVPLLIMGGDQIKKTEMGRAYSMCGARRGGNRFLVGKPEGRSHLEHPGVDGR